MAFEIPDKSKEFVREWARKIQPLLYSGGKLHHIENKCDHWNQSYPWSPKYLGEADDIEEVARIRTLHRYGYYGFFKPSVAEVICQIPDDLLSEVTHFYVNGPDTADDLNLHKEELDAGFHVAETTLYRQKNPVGSDGMISLRDEDDYWQGSIQP